MNKTQIDYLNQLGFSKNENPSIEEIKKRWRDLTLEIHPDRNGDHEAYLKIIEAKNWLLDNYIPDLNLNINKSTEIGYYVKYSSKNSKLEFTPTKDQEKALDLINDFLYSSNQNIFVLKGCAGSGKTSIIAEITKQAYYKGLRVTVGSFTNKATSVIAKKNSSATKMTLFRLLNLKANESDIQLSFQQKFNDRLDHPVSYYDIIVQDEISMLSDKYFNMLKEQVLKYNKKLILVGDPYQLKPIEQEHDSIAFEEPLGYELTEIVRQGKDSDIPVYADQVRKIIDRINTGEKIDIKTKLDKTVLKGAGDIQFFDNSKPFLDLLLADFTSQEYKQNSDYVKVLAYRNNTIDKMNEIIRRNIFVDVKEALLEGEQILLEGSGYRYDDFVFPVYDPSQELLIKRVVEKKIYDETHHGVKLTFPYIVADVESKDDRRQERINLIYPNQKENFNNLMKKWAKEIGKQWDKKKIFREEFYPFKKRFNLPIYGYAITVHKSQGSTMDNIFLIEDDIEQVKLASQKELWAAKYTGLSRASKKLVILNRIK